ncbi:type VII secretion target [Nonomuraea sp. NPDC049419]|uniref:type VII secretion target n=1 Tax=Nonomuraea sp. NPDC049419 TaxID=3155772 RepID=UPI00344034CE
MSDGFTVRAAALRRHSGVYQELKSNAEEARTALRAAFDLDRKTLGDDMYGAELAKKLPGMEQAIEDAFKDYLDDLDGLTTGLHVSSRNYEAADRPPARRD